MTDFELVEFEEMNSSAMPTNEQGKGRFSFLRGRSRSSQSATVTEDDNKGPKPDEVNLLGLRVELKWSSGKWYRGTICDYDAQNNRHYVLYDDGDKKWYTLNEMVFRQVNLEDEWILDDNKKAEENSKELNKLEDVRNVFEV